MHTTSCPAGRPTNRGVPADAIIPSKTNEGFLDVYSRMRRPVVEVEGEQKETGEIFTLLADAMGLIPALPDSAYQAAGSGSLRTYRDALIRLCNGAS